MQIYYGIVYFVLGTILGSFYNVVGYRIPKGESIISPPSHCPNCGHQLKWYELIPIVSFLIQGRKCRGCKQKISWFYPIFEFSSGILFMLSYFIFGTSIELLIALTFISTLLIIIISDYQTMIIPDEVLIVSTILLSIEIMIARGWGGFGISFLHGLISFGIMFLLKLLGDFLFKKESMGGGDIKLMFLFGLVLDAPMALLSIFLAAFIALPISLMIMLRKNTHEIPFGPFLSIGAMIILFSQINWQVITTFITK